MLNETEALALVKKEFPDTRIFGPVEYQHLFIFQVFINVPLESGWDPFVSVDRRTGEVLDYSIIGDGGGHEICRKFEALRGGG
jgi:hypothetical protein